ncbi:MAG: glutaminase A [Deferribacteraceae bacterium]|jgi:glutaminase|nr:glutaminase A [Deferribacteraceae bacterium]
METNFLDKLLADARPLAFKGQVANYIPLLGLADPQKLGLCVAEPDGALISSGDWQERFSIQSISKILVFTLSLIDSGFDKVLEKVSIESTDDAFNSIVNLETKNNHRPLNPLINAGAIVCLTLIDGKNMHEKFTRVLEFTRLLARNSSIEVDEDIYLSEKATAARNRALTYYMLSTGAIEGDVEAILDAYFRICSMMVTCADLARIALVYAQGGAGFFPKEIARTVKAAMCVCGMYDESGQVAVEVGLPTKSGVGGGLLSVAPNRFGIGIYGPALTDKGSSVAGLEVLKKLSKELDLSIF